MNSTHKDLIMQTIDQFLKEHAEAAEYLQQMAEEAEQSQDYSEYDEACYDNWQAGDEAGMTLAINIGRILND